MGMTSANAYEKWMALDGNEISIDVVRGVGAQVRDGLSSSISQEALKSVQEQISMWLLSRLIRYQDETGLMPQVVTLDLKAHLSA